jgi:hypothetical protein
LVGNPTIASRGAFDARVFDEPAPSGSASLSSKPITISGKLGDDAREYQIRAVRKALAEGRKMKLSARYAKIVEWSDEDNCYVGSAPGLVLGGCHGDDERAVFEELCRIVDEAIALYEQDGKPLPPPTSGRDLANRLQSVA